MKPTQIAGVLNDTIIKEITGKGVVPEGGSTPQPIVNEDLSNIVEVGKTVLDFTNASTNNFNSFIETMIDRIGRVKYVDRTYAGTAPNILHDSWEYGSIMQKVRAEVPDFQENTSWKLGDIAADAITNSKVPGLKDYPALDPYVLSLPTAQVKFYNSRITYEAPITITDYQLKSAFTSASEMSRFISMIENRISLKMTLSTDALIMRTINNLIGLKINKGNNVINLLSLYNKEVGAGNTLTASQALKSTEFLRFATKTISLMKDYLKTAGSNYNESDYITFTPSDRLKFVVLTEFAKDMETYLYSDTYHNEFVQMEGYSTVPFWQGQGIAMNDVGARSQINITATDGTNDFVVDQSGIVGVMFDIEAAAVCNEDYRTTSQYNPRGEYTNFFYKWTSQYMNDIQENAIVFLVADYEFVMIAPKTTAPTGWDTTYAIANSPYYIEDSAGSVDFNGKKFSQLSASDKTTAQGFDWDNYEDKEIIKKG